MGLALLFLTLQGLTNHAATTILAQTTGDPNAAPLYPSAAPPPAVTPLPNQRQQQEEQSVSPDYRVGALQSVGDSTLWVGSWQGLAQINPASGKVRARISLPNQTVGALAIDRVGRLWVGTYDGLVRLDPRTGGVTAQNFSLPSNRVCPC